MVMTTAAAALGSVKAVYNLATAAYSLKASTEMRLAISGMLDELHTAKVKAGEALETELALKARVRELEEEIRALKERKSELESYERKRFFPGSFAYVEKETLSPGATQHYACAHCYESGKKIISLQPTGYSGRGGHPLHCCPSCKSEYELGQAMQPGEELPSPAPTPRVIRYPPGPDDWMKS